MNRITVDEDTMKRLITKSDSPGIDTNELANSYILRGLDYDKPEGDDILEKMAGLIDIESELDTVRLKKASQVRDYNGHKLS